MSTTQSPPGGRTGRSRIARHEARRRILEATRRLLGTYRFRDLSINLVMQEAGLSRTIFYRYFDGLPQVVINLLQELVDRVAPATPDSAADHPNHAENVRAGLRMVVELFTGDWPLIRGLLEATASDPEVEEAFRPVVERAIDAIAANIEAGVASGALRSVNAREVARALTLMNGYYLLDAMAGDSPIDPSIAAETLWTVWSATLGIDSAGQSPKSDRPGFADKG